MQAAGIGRNDPVWLSRRFAAHDPSASPSSSVTAVASPAEVTNTSSHYPPASCFSGSICLIPISNLFRISIFEFRICPLCLSWSKSSATNHDLAGRRVAHDGHLHPRPARLRDLPHQHRQTLPSGAAVRGAAVYPGKFQERELRTSHSPRLDRHGQLFTR